jgi:hypothetical protein
MLAIIPDSGQLLTLIPQSGKVSRLRKYASPTVPVINLGASLSGNEGNSGTINFIFGVNRTGPLVRSSTVSWAVTGIGANPANAADFVGGVFPSGTVTFGIGESAKLITVPVNGDATVEADETFAVTLSSPVDATLGPTTTATGTIVDDDHAPTMVTSSPTTIAELQPNVASLTFSEPVTLTSITGTDGALLTVAETGLQTTFTVKRVDGQPPNYEGKTSYSYTMNVKNAALVSAALSMVSNISDVDEVPDTFTFTPKTDASVLTNYQTQYTVSGLAAGVSATFTISGSGATFAKGAGALGTAPVLAQNGDIITINVLSSGSVGFTRTAVLAGGEPSITVGSWAVTTSGPVPTPIVGADSAPGTLPLQLWVTSTSTPAGIRWQWQFAGSLTPATTADGTFTTPTQEGLHFVDLAEKTALRSQLGYANPNGPTAFQMRALIDDEAGAITITDEFGDTSTYTAVTGWSRTSAGDLWTDTFPVFTATFDPTNMYSATSVNKITLSNNNLTMTTHDFGSNFDQTAALSKALTAATGYCEISFDSGAGNKVVGVIDSATAIKTGVFTPVSSTRGAAMRQGGAMYKQAVLQTSTTVAALGDTVGICMHLASKTVWFRNKTGAWANGTPAFNSDGTLSGSATGGYVCSTLSDMLVAASGSRLDTLTVNTGSDPTDPFLFTPPANCELGIK